MMNIGLFRWNGQMMVAEKGKRQHSLPNRQLAAAFQFSASDLAANRHGFMTKAQEWQLPLWMRGIVQQMSEKLFNNRQTKRRKTIESICGRTTLSYKQIEIQGIYSSDIVEVHTVTIDMLEFRVNPKQYQAIGEGLVYQLYYHPEYKRILSLERALQGC